MRVLMLNGSPKEKFSASAFLLKTIKKFLCTKNIEINSLQRKSNYEEILEKLKEIDTLIIAEPLYVDGIPSHVLDFLTLAEEYCKKNNCNFNLYVIANNGFIEGKQNEVHLRMFECWCKRVNVTWGGGIGIGGGVMLHILSIVYPILFLIMIINILISGNAHILSTWIPLLQNIGIYLFLNIGVIYAIGRLSIAICKKNKTKNIYTRVMIPSFVFIIIADIFMFVSALFNGKIIFTLLKKDTIDKSI